MEDFIRDVLCSVNKLLTPAPLEHVPYSEPYLVAKAIAKWADGDSVAGHISYRLDYFCTLYRDVSAGAKSVFSPANRSILEERYQIRFVTPHELQGRLTQEGFDSEAPFMPAPY
jgi:hypothetical protein